MFQFNATEAVGYLASVLLVVSLSMTSVVRLRAISLAGSVAFLVYGVLLESAPLIITNVALAAVNIWFLRVELGLRRDLGASQVKVDSPFLADFVEYHLDDIGRFQPEFVMPTDDPFALVLMRDGLPAGLFIAERHGDELDVVLDYVVRAYRDSRLGNWLYGPGISVFKPLGVKRLVATASTDLHRSYLAGVGFRADGDRFVFELDH